MRAHHYDPVKRLIDIVGAVLGLILTAPLQAVIAAFVRLRLGAPVFFRQRRPGRHGQTFELIKFRTMLEVDPSTGLESDADRLTPFGAMLRSTSLDELPTLWNVLRGHMSLVGPRPLLEQYVARYTSLQSRRHEVRPGVTGLAQVSGRNELTWERKFELDVEYVDSRGLRLDCWILRKTVAATVKRSGVSAPGDVTMPEFLGSQD